eukprot:8042-Heterococcus_DN1.PRE.2
MSPARCPGSSRSKGCACLQPNNQNSSHDRCCGTGAAFLTAARSRALASLPAAPVHARIAAMRGTKLTEKSHRSGEKSLNFLHNRCVANRHAVFELVNQFEFTAPYRAVRTEIVHFTARDVLAMQHNTQEAQEVQTLQTIRFHDYTVHGTVECHDGVAATTTMS